MEQVWQFLLGVLTVEQWKAWGFLIVITSALTETVKRVFLLPLSAGRRKRWVYGIAFLIGVLAATGGALMVGTRWTPLYYWVTFGITAGPAANFLHWLTLGLIGWRYPDLASSLKGGSRNRSIR